MLTDLINTFLNPFLSILQNFVDASFTVVSLFGFSAPNVSNIVSGFLGG